MGSITIGSNISSLKAQRQLGKSTDALSKSSERLSSGLRINRASDDAAGLAVASSLNSKSRVYNVAVRNVNDGISAFNIVDGALSELSAVIIRIEELATQAANGSYGAEQRKSMNSEAQALRNEFNRIVATTSFNGVYLLQNPTTVDIEAGAGESGRIASSVGSDLARTVGTGTFQAAIQFGATAGAQGAAAGDFNRDGKLDVVSVGAQVQLGNGDGTFKAITTISGFGGINARQLSVLDVNNDGLLDIIGTTSSATPFLSIALGNGDGTFRAGMTFASGAGTSTYRHALGDFNGDGRIDAAAQDFTNGQLNILIGNGDGTFQSRVTYATTTTSSLASGDFNEDGQADLVTDDLILLGNGDGSFQAARTYASLSNGAIGYTVDDFNNDGHIDLATGGNAANAALVSLGNGDGSFKASVGYGDAANSARITHGDLTNDGITDIVTAEYNAGILGVIILVGNGDGSFRAVGSYSTAAQAAEPVLGDFTGDGVLDIFQPTVSASPANFLLVANTTKSTTLDPIDLRTRADAVSALDLMRNALQRLVLERGSLGASLSRLSTAASNLVQLRESHLSAEARIMNTDVAEEAAALVQTRILQQAGASILAQANQAPALALTLLSGR